MSKRVDITVDAEVAKAVEETASLLGKFGCRTSSSFFERR